MVPSGIAIYIWLRMARNIPYEYKCRLYMWERKLKKETKVKGENIIWIIED